MGRNKDQWLRETGGFRLWETPEQFTNRVSEIQFIREKLRSRQANSTDIERLSYLLLDDEDD